MKDNRVVLKGVDDVLRLLNDYPNEINKIAKDGKYDLIVQDAVYISPRVDITEQVLKALNN